MMKYFDYTKLRSHHDGDTNSEKSEEKKPLGPGDYTDDFDVVQPQCTCQKRLYYLLVVLLAATTALFALLWLMQAQSSSPATCTKKEATWRDCGSSPAEARANGCHYQPMLGAWIPHECSIDEPDGFHPFEDRVWYQDKELTQPIEVAGLKAGNETEIYTHIFHEEHCLYCWRRLESALERRLPLIDSISRNFAHSNHCAVNINELLLGVANHTIPHAYYHEDPMFYRTVVRMQYASCVPLIDYYS